VYRKRGIKKKSNVTTGGWKQRKSKIKYSSKWQGHSTKQGRKVAYM
jgi:hypothetical protein